MGFLDFFTVVLTCIWWVHREHRFSCWNHRSCISYRNFVSRLRIMIWLCWRERASMHDETLGSHLIYQNTLCETRLTASSDCETRDDAWLEVFVSVSRRKMRLRVQPVKSSVAEAKTVPQKARIHVSFGGKDGFTPVKKRFFYWYKPCLVEPIQEMVEGGSDTSFICTEWICRKYEQALRCAKCVTQEYKLMHLRYKQ